jgi:NADPH:quinone reductase-like Zn-dependent oxidoreductase
MKAVLCERLGDPTSASVLRLANDVPVPTLEPQHMRVRVTAASINFPDSLQIKVRLGAS